MESIAQQTTDFFLLEMLANELASEPYHKFVVC